MKEISKKLKAQAAMEYLMTYGWALLVIVIVIAILVSLNLFSAPQGCSFERPGFTCGSPVIDTNGKLFLPLTNANPNNIKLVGVVCTADKVQEAPSAPASGQPGYFNEQMIYKQSTYEVSNGTYAPSCTKGGALFSGPAGTEFSGKVWVFYKNEEDGTGYPTRTVSANLVTKTVKAGAYGGGTPPVVPCGGSCTGTQVCCTSGLFSGTCQVDQAACAANPCQPVNPCTTPPNLACTSTGPTTYTCGPAGSS